MSLILSSLYFILPAYVANMAPVLGKRFRLPLNIPISKKHLGTHKTWRGFYLGYIGALITLFLQFYLQKEHNFISWNILNYEHINLFLYAFIFGIGALTGDTIKSFFKRMLKIKPGQPFFPFDQLDFIFGALIFMMPFYILPWQNILAILILTPLLHFLTNLLAYLLRFKEVWW